jgi:di/tricarboxylate transporter
VLALLDPRRVPTFPGLVDGRTSALLARVRTERSLALALALVLVLVLVAAGLSMVITNDVALFVFVPMTHSLRGCGEAPLAKLVIFQALAVNAGFALTPIGHPQNLFLWQFSGASAGGFVLAMLLVVAVMLAGLPLLRATLGGPVVAPPDGLFAAAATRSQFVSNVPAAIVLAGYSDDWRTIAWGVSVGGFGTAIASLASTIALRMLGERRAWWTFHLDAVPFLLVTGLAAWALMGWMSRG